jgi:hypothetical protein
MEWLTLPALWGVPAGMPDMWSGYYDQRWEQTEPHSSAEPTELDLALVETLYEAIAAGTFCARCGATLGRRLRLVPSSRPATMPGSWRLLVVTRCHGWLRHPFAADVLEEAGDLRMGQFERV